MSSMVQPDGAAGGLPERVAAVRRELAEHGPPRSPDGAPDHATVSLPERDCDQVRDLLADEQACTVVEIGLAYGGSALAIGEALLGAGTRAPRHVVIDPFQYTVYDGVGWELLRSAGLDGVAELVTEPSQRFLARLADVGFAADAAFVDGSHHFHNVFVDLHFLGGIVRPGGVVLLDDVWWPSVGAAAAYFETNLGWRPMPGALDGGTTDPASGRPRTRAYRLPAPPPTPDFKEFRPFC
ncbi:class I SAM-dependent methyltransferase [Streptomyces sp. WMMB 322]|uniref:class I SAM-dependent methyltransferase n=1 Tax=Streptomyces sp. WMMB 322 TaxID=1286821 RepID=UPI0006E38833|nr:class I SAM-dependent methyltransferase [Streptomyces sp. WMMB 322]SCK08757.1 Predicted O-methyltransferase YrrM [Streptomyces sp. WMMB 322]